MGLLVPTGRKTVSEVTHDKPCLLGGVAVNTDGTNAAAVIVYDSAVPDATGKKEVWRSTDAGINNYGGLFPPHPIPMREGIYVVLSGTGASFNVYEFVA